MTVKLFPNLQAAMHAKVAFSLAFCIAAQESLLETCLEDPSTEVGIAAAELADILAAVTTLATLCRKHNLIDMGCIEQVWSDHLDETALRKLSRRFTVIAEATENELEMQS